MSKVFILLMVMIAHSLATGQPGNEKITQAAGVFLYMACPDNSAKRCVVLIDRNYGANKNTFSNPGGLVDPGETPEKAAAREATEELGEVIKLSEGDLNLDSRNPDAPLKLVAQNVSDAGFGTVEYHMYFKQLPSMTAASILDAIKNYKGHGAGESNAVAIVPLDQLEQAVAFNTPIRIDSQNNRLYASNFSGAGEIQIPLYPQMIQLLRQEVRGGTRQLTWMQLLQDHISHKVTLGFNAQGQTVISPERAEQQFARTIANKAQLAGEVKEARQDLRKIKDLRKYTDSQNKLAALPDTASDAYLQIMMGGAYNPAASTRDMINLFFDKPYTNIPNFKSSENDNFRDALAQALTQERTHKGWYTFYHGTDAKMGFLYDILSTYRARFKAVHAQSSPGLRFLDGPFWGLDNVDDFKAFFRNNGAIDNYQKNYENPNFKEGTLGKKSYQDIGLSVNISLFGSDGVRGSSSIEFFSKGTTHTPPDYKELFNIVRHEIGFDKTWEDFEPLFEEYQRNMGRLYQIFVAPDYLDQIGYLARSGGTPFVIKTLDNRETDNLSYAVNLLRSNHQEFARNIVALPAVQARLFLKPEIFSNPKAVQVKVYENRARDPKMIKAYHDKLNSMVILP